MASKNWCMILLLVSIFKAHVTIAQLASWLSVLASCFGQFNIRIT
jgi:hypothetical protein